MVFDAAGMVLLGGSWEYRRLAGVSGQAAGYLLVLIQAIILAALFWYRESLGNGISLYLSVCCVAWLLLFIRLPLYRPDAKPTALTGCFLRHRHRVHHNRLVCAWLDTYPAGRVVADPVIAVDRMGCGYRCLFCRQSLWKKKACTAYQPRKNTGRFVGRLDRRPLVALLAAS